MTDLEARRIRKLTKDQARSACIHLLRYNAGSISLPVLGIAIGAGHTAFPGDKVWDDSMIYDHPLTVIGYAQPRTRQREYRTVIVDEGDGEYAADELFPTRRLAAQSRRRKILRLYKRRRKWMRIYREGVRDMDRIISLETQRRLTPAPAAPAKH